jgi:hypothetical protein
MANFYRWWLSEATCQTCCIEKVGLLLIFSDVNPLVEAKRSKHARDFDILEAFVAEY